MRKSSPNEQMSSARSCDFTIIIPVIKINDYIRETISHVLEMEEPSWELLIITDQEQETEWPDEKRIKLLSSGRVGPALKRDLGAKHAVGDYLVFLDDDSFPKFDFLQKLKISFTESKADALGGPGITPEQASFWETVSGSTFESSFLSSDAKRYLPKGILQSVDDWPSVNLTVKRSVFHDIGGFDSKYWPGEDTEFCRKLLMHGYSIFYDPSVQVFHHRRSGILKHLKQVGGYGFHRGHFARKFPENSRKFKYFLPSVLFLYFIIVFPLYFVFSWFPIVFPAIVYLAMLFIFLIETSIRRGIAIAAASLSYVVFGHFWYGVQFLRGIGFSGTLVSRLRESSNE
jgi:GT2 family glycosyltransferase